MKSSDLKGIIPATIVPMTKDYKIDESDLRNYIGWMLQQKPKGFAINVDTGEGPHLYPDERKRIVKIYAEEVKGQVPIIAGLSSSFTADAVELAKDTKEAGADAVLVFPIPVYQGGYLDPQIPYQFHKAIADKAGIPIVLFRLQSALAGAEYTMETISKLMEIDGVVGIKEATFNALKFKELASYLKNKEITLLTGNDNFLLESFLLGADGGLLGIGAVGIEALKGMQQSVKEKNFEKAFQYSDAFQPFTDLIFSNPIRDYRARIKEALVIMGIIKNGSVRPPLLPIPESDKGKIKQGLIDAKLI